jgi:hypothetical protein
VPSGGERGGSDGVTVEEGGLAGNHDPVAVGAGGAWHEQGIEGRLTCGSRP